MMIYWLTQIAIASNDDILVDLDIYSQASNDDILVNLDNYSQASNDDVLVNLDSYSQATHDDGCIGYLFFALEVLSDFFIL